MKITLVYTHVVAPTVPTDTPQKFHEPMKRFISTLKQFDPGYAYDLVVVGYGAEVPPSDRLPYNGLPVNFTSYRGQGRDNAAVAYVARHLDADLIIQLSTYTRFHRDGWLHRFVASWLGEGLYGASASYEACPTRSWLQRKFYAPNAHIRTSCWGMSGNMWRKYPHRDSIVNREHGFEFEAGHWNVAKWASSMGYPVRLITWDGSYAADKWRFPPNIFRRGDQSNCLVFDRHHDIFFAANRLTRLMLAFRSNGGTVGLFCSAKPL